MYRFLKNESIFVTRRDLLKLSASAALGTILLPELDWRLLNRLTSLVNSEDELPVLGRVLDAVVTVYNEPSLHSQAINTLKKDELSQIIWVTLGDSEPQHNRIWYKLDAGGYAHSSVVQPVKNILNQPERNFPKTGRLAQVSVPYTDSTWNYRFPEDNTSFRLYYGSTHWITASAIDSNNTIWYLINDDTVSASYYARGTDLRIIPEEDASPLSTDIPAKRKRIEVNISQQVMIAYEDDIPVLITRIATGAKFGDKDLYTPKGEYYTNRKAPSRHMAHRDPTDINSYDVPGVPWVLYLTITGVAFHGTYWHNDYGKPRSHGCINLPIGIAHWLYRWSSPWAPITERLYMTAEGTTVNIF